jgi:hypothetical protein
MEPGEDRRLVHVFVGEPTPDLSEAVVTHNLEHIRIPYTSRRDLPLAILRARRILKSHGVQRSPRSGQLEARLPCPRFRGYGPPEHRVT